MSIFDAYIEFIAFALDKRAVIELHELLEEIKFSYEYDRITLDEYFVLKSCINKCIDAINAERVRNMMHEDIRK